MEDKDLQVKMEDARKEISKIMNLDAAANVIKDNKVEFNYNNITYRVSKPKFKEKEQTNKARIKNYVELL